MDSSVAHIIRERVLNDPCLSDCLARGVVNLSQLARTLAREIEEEGNVRVSVPAAKMALYRLAQRMREDSLAKVRYVLSKSAIIVHDSVAIITIPGSLMSKALAIASTLAEKSRFIQVTQGFRTATIVISSEDKDYMLARLGDPLEVIDNQTAIVIVSPREIIETPGVIAFLTGYLARNGVNITQIISCYMDTIIVLNSSDALKAYNLIHKLIHRNS